MAGRQGNILPRRTRSRLLRQGDKVRPDVSLSTDVEDIRQFEVAVSDLVWGLGEKIRQLADFPETHRFTASRYTVSRKQEEEDLRRYGRRIYRFISLDDTFELRPRWPGDYPVVWRAIGPNGKAVLAWVRKGRDAVFTVPEQSARGARLHNSTVRCALTRPGEHFVVGETVIPFELGSSGWPVFDAKAAGSKWRALADMLLSAIERRIEYPHRNPLAPALLLSSLSALPADQLGRSEELALIADGTARDIMGGDEDDLLDYRWSEVQNTCVDALKLNPDNVLASALLVWAAWQRKKTELAQSQLVTLVARLKLWSDILRNPGYPDCEHLKNAVISNARRLLFPIVFQSATMNAVWMGWDRGKFDAIPGEFAPYVR